MRMYLNKLLVILIFSSFTVFSSVSLISNSYAGEKTTQPGTDGIKKLLLQQTGWEAEWHCDQWPGDWGTELIFKDLGKRIVVKIYDSVNHFDCKRKVKITPDGFTMACCNADPVLLVFDPTDQMYPFKGEDRSCIVKLKAK